MALKLFHSVYPTVQIAKWKCLWQVVLQITTNTHVQASPKNKQILIFKKAFQFEMDSTL